MLNPRLWIDGSSLAFLHGNKNDYQESIYSHIGNLTEKFRTDEFNIILEDNKSNFRNKVATSNVYKGHRRTEKKQKIIADYLPNLKQCFIEIKKHYSPVTYLNIENDDAIAILATRIKNSVMCGNDSDYYGIPGHYYNIKTNRSTFIQYPGEIKLIKNKIFATGYFQTYSQLIKGSPKENYKGVEGMGAVKTFDALCNCKTEEEMKQVCTQLFVDRYGLKEGIIKLEEGFKLSWIITHNESLITPKPIKFSELNF